MKKVTSDEAITFSITTARVLELTPETPVFVQDDEAAILISRLGQHVTVTDATDEELQEEGIGTISDQQKADEEAQEQADKDAADAAQTAAEALKDSKPGDTCTLPDGTEGVVVDTSEAQDGTALACQAKPAPVAGDVCTLEDDSEGVLADDPANPGTLICVTKEA